LKIDFRKVLHGEQTFELQRPLYAGDVVHVTSKISEMYEKKGKAGTMDFLVMETEGRDPSGALLYTARAVIVVRP
jgi:hypothetical protein